MLVRDIKWHSCDLSEHGFATTGTRIFSVDLDVVMTLGVDAKTDYTITCFIVEKRLLSMVLVRMTTNT